MGSVVGEESDHGGSGEVFVLEVKIGENEKGGDGHEMGERKSDWCAW